MTGRKQTWRHEPVGPLRILDIRERTHRSRRREIAENYGDADLIGKLVDDGMWRPTEDGNGYEMLRGPSTDFPMPLRRYGEKPDDGRLISVDEDSLK